MKIQFNPLNDLLSSPLNAMKTRIAANVTDRKVVLVAAACLAFALASYLIFRSFGFYRHKRLAQQEVKVNNAPSEAPRGLILKDLNNEKKTDIDSLKITQQTIYDNMELLRSFLDCTKNSAKLYFDQKGELKQIHYPDGEIWSLDQRNLSNAAIIELDIEKFDWEPNRCEAFSWKPLTKIPPVVEKMAKDLFDELNKAAKGAYAAIGKQQQVSSPDNCWKTILKDTSLTTELLLEQAEKKMLSPNFPIQSPSPNMRLAPSPLRALNHSPPQNAKPLVGQAAQIVDPATPQPAPQIPLVGSGFDDFDAALVYVKQNGNQLHGLDLKGLDVDDDQFKQLIQYCPNLKQLFVRYSKISDKGLENLKGMRLTSVDFHRCYNLTDKAIEHLKGMPLTSVKFSECSYLTESVFEHLKGMPLTSIAFSWCGELTDKAIELLKGMPLTSVDFHRCYNLTDKAIEHLKGMPLTSVNFSLCQQLTDKAIEHLKGMPLTSVNFSLCQQLTDKAMEHLNGMALTSIDLGRCDQLTDKALEHLKGMALTSVNFSWCDQLTDKALEHLKGMPLTSVDFSWCDKLSDKAFEHLNGMGLTSVSFNDCSQLTDKAFEHLNGMPLTSVFFNHCSKLTDKAFERLKGMQLTNVNFNGCQNLTDSALDYLKGMPLTSGDFGNCDKITDKALEEVFE
jgi:uncharacterized protein YjbI with pentapeptide repeats